MSVFFFGFKMGVRVIDKMVIANVRLLYFVGMSVRMLCFFFFLCSVADGFVTPFIILMKAVKCSQSIGSPC